MMSWNLTLGLKKGGRARFGALVVVDLSVVELLIVGPNVVPVVVLNDVVVIGVLVEVIGGLRGVVIKEGGSLDGMMIGSLVDIKGLLDGMVSGGRLVVEVVWNKVGNLSVVVVVVVGVTSKMFEVVIFDN